MTITALNQTCADYFTTGCGLSQIRHPKNLLDRIEGVFRAFLALTVVIPVIIGFTYIVTTPFVEEHTARANVVRDDTISALTDLASQHDGYSTPLQHSPRGVDEQNGETPGSTASARPALLDGFTPDAKAFAVMSGLTFDQQRQVKELVAADTDNQYGLTEDQIAGIKAWPLPAK